MEWLNFHHLRYFWAVAKEGSLARAADRLHVSQPSISEQIRELESALGEKLFRREGRRNVLTEAGWIAYEFAEEIFSLGREMMEVIGGRLGSKAMRFRVGVVDSFPKVVTNEVLKPVFMLEQPVHVICREGKPEDLLAQLAAHRLDLVLSDEPASTSVPFKTFHHELGHSGTTFCAARGLANRLKRGFPRSLDGAPALLPAENTTFRRSLEQWFRLRKIRPRVMAEIEDLALIKVMAAEGGGFIAVPAMAAGEAVKRYQFCILGETDQCRVHFYAITAERKLTHPAVVLLTSHAHGINLER